MEWIKNLEHKRPGRLNQKWEEKGKKLLLQAIEKELDKVGLKVDFSTVNEEVTRGASDLDLVYSGIENIMSIALMQTVTKSEELNVTLRLAAYVNAIERIYACYKSSGLTFWIIYLSKIVIQEMKINWWNLVWYLNLKMNKSMELMQLKK